MTIAEVQLTIQAAGVPPWTSAFCYDASYAKPTADWLIFKFWPWFKKDRWDKNYDKWAPKHDCDNFARRYVIECQDAHADTAQSDEALAVGEFCYINSRGPHAIVIAITDKGVIFIEPQDGRRLALTPQEISTCFRVSF